MLTTDLCLIHAPAVFDFRNRRDIYFPFLGTSGDVPITPLYEYFPLGFKTLQQSLRKQGHDVSIINLSTVLLTQPELNMDRLLQSLDARIFGIDLHWMVHVQGALAIAERLKRNHPDVPVIFGGISSTYYAEQLIEYPFIDMVMRGFDTHLPMDQLLHAIKGNKDKASIPNLVWKSKEKQVQINDFTHTPTRMDCEINWENQPQSVETKSLPIHEIMSTSTAGCAYNCGWCGGSRDAFKRINKTKRSMARKPRENIRTEMDSIKNRAGADKYHFYSNGTYNEPRSGMNNLLEAVKTTGLRSISYEQFFLPSESTLKQMVDANKFTSITLSPESHDIRISKLCGRGTYTNLELEAWIEKALDTGIHNIDIWYFVGMPEQDETSVMKTVDYAQRLLEKFTGKNVNPMLCPMIPFLDPASNFFEQPDKYGYRVFFRTVEEHRRGMERASIINRINYETKWLSRSDLVYVGFKAVRELMQIKADVKKVPRSWVSNYNSKIDDALQFLPIVHEVDNIADPNERKQELGKLGDEILARNNAIFFSGVRNQAMPLNRKIGGRWIDELGFEKHELVAMAG